MKRPIMLVLALVTLLLAVACSSESKQNQPVATKTGSGASTAPPASEAAKRNNALVRVISTIPGNKSFDIYADDQKIFESIAFKTVTPYKELSDSRHAFRLRTAGQNEAQPLAENSEGLSGGKHYTIVVMPSANGQASMYLLNDNLTTASDDVAKVRVINASPDAGQLDVVEKQQNKELFSGVNFESGTSYANVNPMSTTLEVRQDGQEKAIVTVPNAKFEKGKYYTIVVTGNLKGGPAIQTLMVEDQLGASTTPSTAS